ncbi:MAG: aminoacyl-tRNA hydrolase [Flavobacteriaceae bacterium]|nr:aminoacyl-tRNA hydrolase [Flavobacteriaceae bacterium]
MNIEEVIKELSFKAIRSSGAGGQHVNKTSSKIELTFDIENSDAITEKEKEILQIKWNSKLSNENKLILFCEEFRSQHRNKELAIKRFLDLLKTSLKKTKKRKATKPTIASVKKRLDNKQINSNKKALRKKPKIE